MSARDESIGAVDKRDRATKKRDPKTLADCDDGLCVVVEGGDRYVVQAATRGLTWCREWNPDDTEGKKPIPLDSTTKVMEHHGLIWTRRRA